ncbi:MAG TPA: DUF6089 family protein [Bacteroidia bacterium]|nr:DUF6089 family protein [Bacteroidia bacterium]
MKRVSHIFIYLMLLSTLVFSQSRNKYKYELIGGIGPTGFLGDLGGSSQVGSHFLKDYNFSTTRFNVNAGLRYKKITSSFGFKGMLTYAMVSGNDALAGDKIRHNRNLNFRSPIIELSVQAEYYFIGEKSKNLYSIGGLHSKKKNRKFTSYLFTGVGIFFYNPKEELGGTWYSVKKYHTEGQGLAGGPKQFSNFNVAIPVGLGFRYAINKRFSIGAELSVRKTFTDYIDGVSGRYYDKIKLQQAYGATAVALADPSLGTIPGATSPNGDGSGAQRGNPKYKDSYMLFTVNVCYKFKLKKQHRTRAKF